MATGLVVLMVSEMVKNVVPFGAFVDIGVGIDGLLHSSQVRRLGHDEQQGLKPGARVQVRVGSIDMERKRVGLHAPGQAPAVDANAIRKDGGKKRPSDHQAAGSSKKHMKHGHHKRR